MNISEDKALKEIKNIDALVEKLYIGEYIPTESDIKLVCDNSIEQLEKEDVVLRLESPLVIVGDIHGQFYDLLEIFRIAGRCPVCLE